MKHCCTQAQEAIVSALHERDQDGCTPLHLAVLGGMCIIAISVCFAASTACLSSAALSRAGHVECVKLILAASARTTQALEASPVLHVATCLGAHSAKQQAAFEISSLLLTHGSSLHARYVPCARGAADCMLMLVMVVCERCLCSCSSQIVCQPA